MYSMIETYLHFFLLVYFYHFIYVKQIFYLLCSCATTIVVNKSCVVLCSNKRGKEMVLFKFRCQCEISHEGEQVLGVVFISISTDQNYPPYAKSRHRSQKFQAIFPSTYYNIIIYFKAFYYVLNFTSVLTAEPPNLVTIWFLKTNTQVLLPLTVRKHTVFFVVHVTHSDFCGFINVQRWQKSFNLISKHYTL